jgi:Tfp pilus assembly protein PilF
MRQTSFADMDRSVVDAPRETQFLVRAFVGNLNGNDEGVAKSTEQALKIDPKNANAYMLRGETRLNAGKTDLARKDYREALKLAPSNRAAITNGAFCSCRRLPTPIMHV